MTQTIQPAQGTRAHTRTVMVSEIFGPTIQGEGALIGKPTVFVRTGGCDYRCSWCDSLYAVLPEHKGEWQAMDSAQIFAEVRRLSGDTPLLVTLSGGNPAIQPLEELIELGHQYGYTFAIETQGSVAQPWFAMLDYLTLSPKPPSSKQVTRWERLERCIVNATNTQPNHEIQICLKIVIFNEEDYAYARYVAEQYPAFPMYLQAGNHTPPQTADKIDISGILDRMDWLIQRTIADHWYGVTVLPQLHTLLWGNKRGV
ncbi:7-carboxy-7-deazaguanine synthase QueE [Dictyobacter arantiisoli]|uniref:7-carboxy-7-deazaguanine synthase n=1 Tax=Dictyobacter arantiisoli TaxID=2014874 RepID=A0A5A5T7H4_9CHLR|nr:7-carboxy-7-deazaguanine synthase QueE [Dictyobacter arantiisoli]GCF06953.1 7-carboxy-7-deazaguanine synthase [Dictyobacter arantiisoli]